MIEGVQDLIVFLIGTAAGLGAALVLALFARHRAYADFVRESGTRRLPGESLTAWQDRATTALAQKRFEKDMGVERLPGETIDDYMTRCARAKVGSRDTLAPSTADGALPS